MNLHSLSPEPSFSVVLCSFSAHDGMSRALAWLPLSPAVLVILLPALFMLCDLWGLSSLTRDQTPAMAVKVLSHNHWATSEFLIAS